MYTIGLTGGMGSGKTTVARIFECLGIPVYYADAEAKKLIFKNPMLKAQLKKLLGKEAYHNNGRPNKQYIASKIFTNKAILKSMNAIVHPVVREDFILWTKRQDSAYVIEESAIIFEINGQSHFDKVIIVTAEQSIRIGRIIQRDKTSKKAILERMKNQLSDEIKIPLADYVIHNNGDKSLITQITEIHKQILKSI